MNRPDPATSPRGLALLFARRRLVVVVVACSVLTLFFALFWKSSLPSLYARVLALGVAALLAFGLFEQWPTRLPRWCARWVLQVLAVGLVIPIVTLAVYVGSTPSGQPPFWLDNDRLGGFVILCVFGMLLAPWIALAALVRQKEALARHQALAFALERSELERSALDARMHLLQAQVQPHFLFNTLANVRALVASGSAQATSVLDHLIAYLRAAIPRIGDVAATFDEELDRVHAYLELMHLRMPDRLQFEVSIDEDARALACPPMAVLTLVENAVRHGIDPAEDGGRVEVRVERHGPRCRVAVTDTGVGLHEAGGTPGTGLSTLRERLRLAYGDTAQLRITALAPHGVRADIDVPAIEADRT